jgi:hypothetical protein
MNFDLFVGIDYSGAETATSRLSGLQVYTAQPGCPPENRRSATLAKTGQPCNWSRKEIAEWLITSAQQGVRYIAGIDHAFSFPRGYFERYDLTNWLGFVDDFVEHWPTHLDGVTVESIRRGVPPPALNWPGPRLRIGTATEFRLCERWTSSTQSVFKMDGQGIVGKSTHAGIPWLKHVRDVAGDLLHIWPFDGWRIPEAKSVLAEVYPSIFRNRFDREGRSVDEQDAYAVSRWLSESATGGYLARYLNPPLTPQERQVAEREGWILGVT